jgi:hypothetical protein
MKPVFRLALVAIVLVSSAAFAAAQTTAGIVNKLELQAVAANRHARPAMSGGSARHRGRLSRFVPDGPAPQRYP